MTMANPVLGKDSNWLKPCPTGLTIEELKALKNVWELNQIQIYPPVFLWLCFSDSKKKQNNVEPEVWFLFWLLKSIWVFWEGHKTKKFQIKFGVAFLEFMNFMYQVLNTISIYFFRKSHFFIAWMFQITFWGIYNKISFFICILQILLREILLEFLKSLRWTA